MLTLLATTLTTSEAYAAKSSSAKPKPKPGATGNNLSPLEKADKIVSIGQNIFSAANAVWDGVNRTEDYGFLAVFSEKEEGVSGHKMMQIGDTGGDT